VNDRRKENSSNVFYWLSACIIGIAFLAILISSVWTYYNVIEIYQKSNLKNTELLARGAGLAISDKLLEKDYAEIESILKKIFLNKDLDIATVADLNGKKILALKRGVNGEVNLFFDSSPVAIHTDMQVETQVETSPDSKLKVLQKVNAGIPVGWLYLELSNSTERLVLGKLKTNIFIVICFIFFVFVIIALFVNRNIQKNFDKDVKLIKDEKNFWNSRANEDPLTKLPNRMSLNDYLKSSLVQANQLKSHVGIIFFDLDGFKEVNDRYGHIVGDSLLIQVANRLLNYIRPMDRIIRYGGDEFVVIFNNIYSRPELEVLIQRLAEQINLPFKINGQVLNINASIGVTLYPLDGTDHIDELISHADEAMYVAKKLGKNQIYWYC
jgi:diguanylate cyclase (GGDEF)-like protein